MSLLPESSRPARHRLIAALALLACGCGSAEFDGPVVVLVTLDTTRADHLGCYGAPTPGISPRLDALAAGGVRFDAAISQAAVTPVSHASIFTGLYPYNHGLRVMHGRQQNRLDPAQVTLAEILRDVGYETGAFVSAFPVTEFFGFDQGFDAFDADFDTSTGRVGAGGAVNTGAAQRTAGETTDRALAWIAEREQPFFLWLHYFDPHDETVVPPAEDLAGFERTGPEREWRRALYDLELTYMDRELGRVFDALEERGLWSDAVVVVTADHGEGLGDHDWWTHGVLYQEQVRVPLIVRAPGLPADSSISATVRSIDIAPTVIELLGLAPEDAPAFDGVSLVGLMRGEVDDLGLSAYADSVNTMNYAGIEGEVDRKRDLLFAIVLDGRWKYIHHLKKPENNELYDLIEDPGELNNVVASRTDIVKRANEELKAVPFMPFEQLELANTPPEVLEMLRKLGYTGDEASGEDDSDAGKDSAGASGGETAADGIDD